MVLRNDYLGLFFRSWYRMSYFCVCVCMYMCIEAHCLDPDSPAGCAGPLEPCDPCSQQRFSTSFIHLIDMQPIIHAEYHMKREKRV